MTLIQLRKKVRQSVETADEKLLAKLLKVLEKEELKIVGYTIAGKPVTKAEAKRKLKKSEEDIKNGQYLTTNELKKRMAQWQKKATK